MRLLTACVMAALAISGIASAHASDANKALVTIGYTDTVAPAEMQAYEVGIKAYNQCLREHGVKYNVYAVSHETGRNTYKTSYYREPMMWAQRDAMRSMGSESDPIDD